MPHHSVLQLNWIQCCSCGPPPWTPWCWWTENILSHLVMRFETQPIFSCHFWKRTTGPDNQILKSWRRLRPSTILWPPLIDLSATPQVKKESHYGNVAEVLWISPPLLCLNVSAIGEGEMARFANEHDLQFRRLLPRLRSRSIESPSREVA